MGLAGRALGLTLDRVSALDVVTADGERRRVSGGDDLFWALRGGGGSFAVVTAVHLRARAPAARRVVLRVLPGERARGGPGGLGRASRPALPARSPRSAR